jgi:glycosyltransferase involved in cell wall biosynthesis
VEKAQETLPVELVVLDRIFSPTERDRFLDSFDLYLFPTLREPFGITVVETGARGLPVVTTDSPGPKYLLETAEQDKHDWGWLTEYGVLVKRTDDPERNLDAHVAEGLVATLEDWPAAARRTLAFHHFIKDHFTWENVVRSYVELYQGG